MIKNIIPIINNLNLKFEYSWLFFDFKIKKHAIKANKGKYKGKQILFRSSCFIFFK